MTTNSVPPISEQAFYSADSSKIRDAVILLTNELGLSQGSISSSNQYKSYDFYKLIKTYMQDSESRLKIHKIINVSGD